MKDTEKPEGGGLVYDEGRILAIFDKLKPHILKAMEIINKEEGRSDRAALTGLMYREIIRNSRIVPIVMFGLLEDAKLSLYFSSAETRNIMALKKIMEGMDEN